MSDTIEVSHCGECPLHRYTRHADGVVREHCAVDSRRIWPDESERPEWCPLEGAPVTIRLRLDGAS